MRRPGLPGGIADGCGMLLTSRYCVTQAHRPGSATRSVLMNTDPTLLCDDEWRLPSGAVLWEQGGAELSVQSRPGLKISLHLPAIEIGKHCESPPVHSGTDRPTD